MCTVVWEEPFICRVAFRSVFSYDVIQEFVLTISETKQCVVDFGLERTIYETHMDFNDFIKLVTRRSTDMYNDQTAVIRLIRRIAMQYEVMYKETQCPFQLSGGGHSFSLIVKHDGAVRYCEGLYETIAEFDEASPRTHHYMAFIQLIRRCFEALKRQTSPPALGPREID